MAIVCVKQLKTVVLVQFSHLEVIVARIVCTVMLVQTVQHHHNGNEKVNQSESFHSMIEKQK